MKENHIFYAPSLAQGLTELPPEEAGHAVRVLRKRAGDIITLTDGAGMFYEARVTLATPRRCLFSVESSRADTRLWRGTIHLAVAPTKNMDRMEWLVEKATEIGVDRITLLDCDNSERHVVKTERLEKISVSAMKQSHKAWKPVIEDMTPLRKFLTRPFTGQRFIAHCHEAGECGSGAAMHLSGRNFMGGLLHPEGETVALIGPEGDFSTGEVCEAVAAGFSPVSLGESRLRTETAALVAVHLMYLAKRFSTNNETKEQ